MGNPTMQSLNGAEISILNTAGNTIDAYDIAVSLSRLPRFGGHSIIDWSVAQHSLLVAKIVDTKYPQNPRLTLAALLHDAHEAIIGADIISPFKRAITELVGYDVIGHITARIDSVLFPAFGLPDRLHEEDAAIIKEADMIALATEKRDLMKPAFEWTAMELPEPFPTWLTGTSRSKDGGFKDYLNALEITVRIMGHKLPRASS